MNNVAPAPNFSLTKSAAERIVLLLKTETGPYFFGFRLMVAAVPAFSTNLILTASKTMMT